MYQPWTNEPWGIEHYIALITMLLVSYLVLSYTLGRISPLIRTFVRAKKAARTRPRPQVKKKELAKSSATTTSPTVLTSPIRIPWNIQPPLLRGNVLLAGQPKDGKTQALIRFLVSDLSAGIQCVVISPHFTYYHERDQPVDLRTIRDRFLAFYGYREIEVVLRTLAHIVTERMKGYREGEDHVPLVAYIDEWPAIVTELGDDAIISLRRILFEGRKVNVFVVLATQTAILKTIGMNSGDRSIFRTILLSKVDKPSWDALLPGHPFREQMQWGDWASNRGNPHYLFTIEQVVGDMIQDILTQPSTDYSNLLDSIPAETNFVPSSDHETNVQRIGNGSKYRETVAGVSLETVIANLVHTGAISETKLARIGFGIAPGGSARYQELRSWLHELLQEHEDAAKIEA